MTAAFTLGESEIFNHSPGFHLACRGWVELLEAGLSSHELIFAHDHKTIFATQDDRIVGVLVWFERDYVRDAFIQFAYVDPDYRLCGIYTALYTRLREKARARGYRQISGITSSANVPLHAAARRLGRRVVAVTFADEIEASP